MEVDGVALRGKRLRDSRIVRVVLLVETAGDRGRHRPGTILRVQHGADETVDAGEAPKAALLRVGAAAEVAPRLEEEPGERPWLEPVGMEEREAAKARSQ